MTTSLASSMVPSEGVKRTTTDLLGEIRHLVANEALALQHLQTEANLH